MNGTTRRPVMSTPLTRPQSAAAATPPSRRGEGDQPARSSSAMTTVVSATTDPTDRSMPPDTMTIVMPSAAVQTIAGLPRDQLEVAGREELRADEHAEDDRDEREARARGPPVAGRRARAVAARGVSAAPVAAIISSVLGPLGGRRAAPSRPRRITAMRSHRPSSSGR